MFELWNVMQVINIWRWNKVLCKYDDDEAKTKIQHLQGLPPILIWGNVFFYLRCFHLLMVFEYLWIIMRISTKLSLVHVDFRFRFVNSIIADFHLYFFMLLRLMKNNNVTYYGFKMIIDTETGSHSLVVYGTSLP